MYQGDNPKHVDMHARDSVGESSSVHAYVIFRYTNVASQSDID